MKKQIETAYPQASPDVTRGTYGKYRGNKRQGCEGEPMNKVVREAAIGMIKDMAPYEVDPPAIYRRTGRRTISVGQCYNTAYDYIISLHGEAAENARLIHGSYTDYPLKGGHAWIEIPGSIVYDGVTKRFYNKEAYCRIKGLIEVSSYTRGEIIQLGLKNRHFGPYDRTGEQLDTRG